MHIDGRNGPYISCIRSNGDGTVSIRIDFEYQISAWIELRLRPESIITQNYVDDSTDHGYVSLCELHKNHASGAVFEHQQPYMEPCVICQKELSSL